jgi:predicted O-methyltransferase YrrM
MNDLTLANEPAAIQAVWDATRLAGFSMAADPLTCSLLRTLAASKPGGRLLELGSGTGLSTAWLLDGMDARAHLTTMDHDDNLLSIVRNQLGHDQRLSIVCADGDEFIGSLKGQQFDLIFADTWSGKYRLLDEALALVRPGGVYVIDDMLPQPNWPEGHAHKAGQLMAALAQRRDFHITNMCWASGIILAARR